VSKDTKKAIEVIEEGVFAAHELVQVINKAVIVPMSFVTISATHAVQCTHISSEGRRSTMVIPLLFGDSSRGKLRAIEYHREIWKKADACVRVHLQHHVKSKGRYPVTFTDELLFVTRSYTEKLSERMAWIVIGCT
jgi:hypothetical protein